MTPYNLKDKMDKWGPFEEHEFKWHLFSIGNPNEGHGLALPRAIDDFHAKKIAYDLERETGQRYVGHIPFTTDRCGPIAKEWAPAWRPWDEFLNNTINFIRYHIDLIRGREEPVKNVMVLIGHGGNADLLREEYQKQIEKTLDLERFIPQSATISGENAVQVLDELEPLAEEQIKIHERRFNCEDPEELAFFYTRILMSAGHASHAEHSLAAAMGLCDMEKVSIMNRLLERDFEKALEKWPPIGGLGGYLLKGGKYTEALGTETNDKYGLWNCLNGLRSLNNGKLMVAPEVGHLVQKISLKLKKDIILQNI
ncbi:MAG: hypothetical protein R6U96_03645 [Promethearchaeia archaeon]